MGRMTKRERIYKRRIRSLEAEINKMDRAMDQLQRTVIEYQMLHISQGIPFTPMDEEVGTGVYYHKKGILHN